MPNHVTNILKFEGKESDIENALKRIINDEGELDFDTFAKMPEVLRKVSSPVRVVSQEEYDKRKKELEDKKAKGEHVYLETLPLTADMQKEYLFTYGYDNWYDWSIDNWGTKWNAYRTVQIGEDKLEFQTAWSTPFEAMVKLSMEFPELKLKVIYADENFGSNVGEYIIEGGKPTYQYIPDNGTIESFKLAFRVLGDGVMYDYLCYVADGEFSSETSENMVELAMSVEYIDYDLPDNVLEMLMGEAVERENYEYAQKLKELIGSDVK